MHRLLQRQLRRHLGSESAVPSELEPLVKAVEAAYEQYDADRSMLERSLELSSNELLSSNAELNAIFEVQPDLFIRLDAEDRVVGIHGGMGTRARVVRPGAGYGVSVAEALVPEVFEAVVLARGRLDETRRHFEAQCQLACAEGALSYSVRVVQVPPDHRLLLVVRDVTDAARAAQAEVVRREQEARVRAMEEFAYIASHDLRAPLRAIQQLAEWLEEDVGGELAGESREHLTLIRARVGRLDALLSALLEYCRVGEKGVRREMVDTGELITGIADLIDDGRFEIRVAPGLPRFETARGPLERVFLNLITNAIKHHDRPTGVIEIDAIELPEAFRFTVADDGPGIPVNAREKVFKMFTRLRSGDEVEGSGMGLALIKRIVDEAGGELGIADAPERGAVFHFTWPKRWRS